MGKCGWVLVLSVAAAAVRAEEAVTADVALDTETCKAVAAKTMRAIEAYTRMKFRRRTPVLVEPRAIWEARLKQEGFAGGAARIWAAYYDGVQNTITVVPWTIGGFDGGSPVRRTRSEWVLLLESIMIHELMHALHNQNFHVVLGGARTASLRADGLSEAEIDEATVEFLASEGIAELVSARVVSDGARYHLARRPERELSGPEIYWMRYQPDGKRPFRLLLSDTGYQDGLSLLHRLAMKAGPRGLRAILYRPPPRSLFFQPDFLAQAPLDDPPDPDSIFGFLSPDLPEGTDVLLAVNPGEGRLFRQAAHVPGGPQTCLIGYVTETGEQGGPHGRSRYAFYVADPDAPGDWSATEAASLKELHPEGAKERPRPLPFAKGVTAAVLEVRMPDKSVYLRAEAAGLVVLAHETKPTRNLEERVLLALRALWMKRPTPKIYAEAAAAAQKVLDAKRNG